MPRSSRAKGVKGEREVRRIWEAAGLTVRGLEGEGDHLVVSPAGPLIHSEVKRQERVRLPEWLRQAADEAPAGACPVVAWRQSRGAWYAVLPLEILAGLLARPAGGAHGPAVNLDGTHGSQHVSDEGVPLVPR